SCVVSSADTTLSAPIRLPGFPHSWCTETRTPTCPTASRRPRFPPETVRTSTPSEDPITASIRPSGRMRPSECRRIGSRLERSGPDGSEELAWAGQGRRGLVRHRHQHTSHRDVGVVAQTLRTSTPIRHISEDRPQTPVVSEFQWSRLSTPGGLSSPIPGNCGGPPARPAEKHSAQSRRGSPDTPSTRVLFNCTHVGVACFRRYRNSVPDTPALAELLGAQGDARQCHFHDLARFLPSPRP